MIIGLRPRTPPGTDRARRAPAETQRTTGQAVIGAGPAGAGLLYDSRRGVYYAKPLLRGWLPHVGAAAVCQYAAIARFAG